MSKFAYVENGKVLSTYDNLPRNWGRYSNFYLLESDIRLLNSLGWYQVKKVTPTYDSNTQKLGVLKYTIEDNIVTESNEIVNLQEEEIVQEETPVEKTEEQLAEEEAARILALEIEMNERTEREWSAVRERREQLMKDTDWRYLRYDRESRLELETTDDITYLDEYMQSLANITNQENPFEIVWPELQLKNSE